MFAKLHFFLDISKFFYTFAANYLRLRLMEHIYTLEFFNNFLFVMALVGLVVFITLFFVDAGYGKMRTEKWGPAINNKVGWFLMEAPVFVVMLYLWAISEVRWQAPYWAFFLIFQFHYFQRSFVFLLVEGQFEDAGYYYGLECIMESYQRLRTGLLAFPSGSYVQTLWRRMVYDVAVRPWLGIVYYRMDYQYAFRLCHSSFASPR